MTVAVGQAQLSVPVLTAVLAAAVLHATWNAIAHAITDRLVGFALIGGVSTFGGLVLVLVSPAPASASWGYFVASAVVHVLYNLSLMRGYQLGEFGQVYPLARGFSPWLVAIGGAVFAGEYLPAVGIVGIVVVSAGLITLVFAGGALTRVRSPAVGAALLTGVTIATYTTIDGLGVRESGSVAGYTGWLFLLNGPALPIAFAAARRGHVWRELRPHAALGALGGVLSLGAYGLVLWAQTRGALAPIAALRETSVIIGAIIGAVIFKESFGRWRIAATVLVATGVILINL